MSAAHPARVVFCPRAELETVAAQVPAGSWIVTTDELAWRLVGVAAPDNARCLLGVAPVFLRPTGADLTGQEGTYVLPDGDQRFVPAGGATPIALVLLRVFEIAGTQMAEAAYTVVSATYPLRAGAAIAAGDPVKSDATSRPVPAPSGEAMLGIALTAAAAAGDVVLVQSVIALVP